MRGFRNSNSSILQPELASRNFRNSDVPSYLTAPPSSEEWSPDLDHSDAVIDDHRTVANEEADPDNKHPTQTYEEIRSPTSTPTRHETLVDAKTPRFAYATHPRVSPSATSNSISGNTSGSYMAVRDSPTALHAALPFPSNAVTIGWNAPNSDTAAGSNVPIRYILSPHSPNFILVLPSSDAADTRPLYRISVNSNCFIPSSYVTTIRRGGSEDGEFAGDFERFTGQLDYNHRRTSDAAAKHHVAEGGGSSRPRQFTDQCTFYTHCVPDLGLHQMM
ncbi:uncharacterized protein STEHIDRAFT_161341 [Stereum hirsutum FP-91666 SS1]|uniref:uncharacterized protein n=1 Tax=Stereum hirsutum (strain FP-91666) TaxID=721885 RepID=UPI0004449D41|nr:uncharacterized protein STEHIDRAFT_161341 [Stereum hirsutum FP-91666 SS1]EIM81989.1 hypothetical protein STEHIDRAFT_161341 [Stereum hirsutum FP-91666 SS1]